MRFPFFLVLLVFTIAARAEEIATRIPTTCRQLVVVTAPEWRSTRGTLDRLERERAGAPWRRVGAEREVMLGENGLGWGIGLHETAPQKSPRKREGDRRAPAGIFRLTGAFGFAPAANVPISRFPYRKVVPGMEVVDDPASRFYNQIVQRASVPSPDWKSSERMAEIDEYELGIVVAHNPKNISGAGSCIFIHQRRSERRGTAGCTTLRPPDLLELVRWLDAKKNPTLIQLPRSEIPEGL